MVKIDIIRSLQASANLSYSQAEELVNTLVDLVKQTLEDGENILVSGFGKFELRDKPPRPGRDPKTKKEYPISARRVVTFYPSKVWRQDLNG